MNSFALPVQFLMSVLQNIAVLTVLSRAFHFVIIFYLL